MLPRPALDEDRDTDDLGASLLECGHGSEHRRARRGCVLDGEHPPAGHVRSLDPALQAVRLLRLPHDERVDRCAPVGGGVHHRVGHRVRA